MKPNRLFLLVVGLLAVSAGAAHARAVRIWPYQELLDKSDLVVIAIPAATTDTKEHTQLPGGEPVIGVDTNFTVSAVLKGDPSLKDFVFHHYRTSDGTSIPHVPNGPGFVSFAPAPENPTALQRKYVLFLLRERDGRYAPVVGQSDPGLAVKDLEGVGINAGRTLTAQLADVLKVCQRLARGTTRAELSKAFTTEGGLSTARHRTYVYRSCPYVKIDVDFAPSDSKQGPLEERPTDTIVHVSKPYLDWIVSD